MVFNACVEREIYNRIFPHLENERDYGYPFTSDAELQEYSRDGEVCKLKFVQDIERDIIRMPKAYGEAFRYILHRDVKSHREMPASRIRMFAMLARRRVYPETCDPRLVARRA